MAMLALASIRLWSAPQAHADSRQVSDLLSQAKTQAAQLSRDASDMEAFSHMSVSWQAHANQINSIRSDVNDTGKTVAKLNQAQEEAAPWQKTAIDRINPLLRELADNVSATINHLDKEQGKFLNNAEHQEYLKTNADLAGRMSALISDFVDYGQTRAKFRELSRKLELSERGGHE